MFENQKTLNLEVKDTFLISDLIEELRMKHLKEKEEMFI